MRGEDKIVFIKESDSPSWVAARSRIAIPITAGYIDQG